IDPRVQMHYVPTLHPRHVPDADAVVATAWRTAESVARYPAPKGEKFYLVQHHETWDGPAGRVDATFGLQLRKIVIARWLEDLAVAMGSSAFRLPGAIDQSAFGLSRPMSGRPRR